MSELVNWPKPLANWAIGYTSKTVVAGCSSVNAKFVVSAG
jgi:hypothetical protein